MPLGMTVFFGAFFFFFPDQEIEKKKKAFKFPKIHWDGADGELMSRFLYALNYLTEVLSDLEKDIFFF